MKIICACDSYKGSLTTEEILALTENGVQSVFGEKAEFVGISVADGGEGTTDALLRALSGKKVSVVTKDPLGRKIETYYGGFSDGTAVIEMAQASGLLRLAKEERNPRITSTYGTGCMIADAIHRGYKHLVITLGGSGTNDGGMGAMEALGVRFLDREGNALSGMGENLAKVCAIDHGALERLPKEVAYTLLCDVTNPLTGEEGATKTFGRQKGASEEDIEMLEQGMLRYETLLKRQYGWDGASHPGSGAAGGLAAALLCFLHAKAKRGIDTVLDLQNFDARIADADLILTGEGKTDSQTLQYKAPMGVALRGRTHGIPVCLVSGTVGLSKEELRQIGIVKAYETKPTQVSVAEAMEHASEYYEATVCRALREFPWDTD